MYAKRSPLRVEENDDAFAAALAALSNPVRLAVVRALRSPKAMRDIEVHADGDPGARPLARQTVTEHLERLVDCGIVRARDATRPYGATMEYFVDHGAIFALTEQMRGLARVRPTVPADSITTASPDAPPPPARRPCLVTVKGIEEGRSFALAPGERSAWLIGRRAGADVPIDFDPFVSLEHARIKWRDGAHWLTDEGSTNGTQLNFAPLAGHVEHKLSQGDVVRVGRSLFVYWS